MKRFKREVPHTKSVKTIFFLPLSNKKAQGSKRKNQQIKNDQRNYFIDDDNDDGLHSSLQSIKLSSTTQPYQSINYYYLKCVTL